MPCCVRFLIAKFSHPPFHPFPSLSLSIRPCLGLCSTASDDTWIQGLMLAIMRAAKTRQWQVVADVDPELDMESLQLQV